MGVETILITIRVVAVLVVTITAGENETTVADTDQQISMGISSMAQRIDMGQPLDMGRVIDLWIDMVRRGMTQILLVTLIRQQSEIEGTNFDKKTKQFNGSFFYKNKQCSSLIKYFVASGLCQFVPRHEWIDRPTRRRARMKAELQQTRRYSNTGLRPARVQRRAPKESSAIMHTTWL